MILGFGQKSETVDVRKVGLHSLGGYHSLGGLGDQMKMNKKRNLENKPLKRREAPDSSFALVRAHQ